MAEPTVYQQFSSGSNSSSDVDDTAVAHAAAPNVTAINGGTFGSGPDTLVLSLSEDTYEGNAQTIVSIDGMALTSQPITVTALHAAGQYELFTFKGSFGTGAHNLGVQFTNDAYGGTPTTDRNLYLNAGSYDGIAPRPSSATFLSSGTQNFTIPPASDPEATSTVINGGTFGSGPDTLVLSLSEDAYKGNAQAMVTIDGTALTADPITVSALQGSAQTETFTFKGSFGPSAHNLGIQFINDAYAGTPSTDRNLYLNNATYDGVASRPSSATFLSGGTQNFTIPPAGDPEAVGAISGGTFGSGPDTLVLSLSEDAYKGDAQATVAIDGHALTSQAITVTASHGAGQTETFTFKGSFGPGAHDLALSFLNDAYGGTPSADRNLYLNNATYDGIASRPSTATFLGNGTQHFTIPPVGDPETSHTALLSLTGH